MKLDGLVWGKCAECKNYKYLNPANVGIHTVRGECVLCKECFKRFIVPDYVLENDGDYDED